MPVPITHGGALLIGGIPILRVGVLIIGLGWTTFRAHDKADYKTFLGESNDHYS